MCCLLDRFMQYLVLSAAAGRVLSRHCCALQVQLGTCSWGCAGWDVLEVNSS